RGYRVVELFMKVASCYGFKRKPFDTAIACFDKQLMMEKIKGDIDGSPAIGHRRRGEPARSHEERCVPPMIDERSKCDAHLADDLRPQMQRVTSFAPRRERQIRPYCVFAHALRSYGFCSLDDEAANSGACLSSSLGWSCCCCWNTVRFCSGAVTSANRSQACAMWDRIARASRSPNVRAISRHCCARRRYSSALFGTTPLPVLQ